MTLSINGERLRQRSNGLEGLVLQVGICKSRERLDIDSWRCKILQSGVSSIVDSYV